LQPTIQLLPALTHLLVSNSSLRTFKSSTRLRHHHLTIGTSLFLPFMVISANRS
jgi:hypothetical protein